jgi:hypothetical protein
MKGKVSMTFSWLLALICGLGIGILFQWLFWEISFNLGSLTAMEIIWLILGIIFILVSVYLIFTEHLLSGFALGIWGLMLLIQIIMLYLPYNVL